MTSALALGLLILALCAILMILVLAVQRRNVVKARRRAAVLARWRSLFVQALESTVADVPLVGAAEGFAVMRVWNDFSEVRRDEAPMLAARRRRLNTLARCAGIDTLAKRYVGRGDLAEKMVGATALGHLGERSAIDPLRGLVGDPDGDVSLAAAHALLKIEPSAASGFVESLRDRSDWLPTRAERAIQEARDLLAIPFLITLRTASGEGRLRLLAFADVLGRDVTRVAVHETLAGTSDPDTIAAALRALRSFVEPADVVMLASFAQYEHTAVRVQAVNAIGTLESARARDLLLERLHDTEHWVRLRAAQALATMLASQPGARREALQRVSGDRYAHEVLAYAFECGADAADVPPPSRDRRASDRGSDGRLRVAVFGDREF